MDAAAAADISAPGRTRALSGPGAPSLRARGQQKALHRGRLPATISPPRRLPLGARARQPGRPRQRAGDRSLWWNAPRDNPDIVFTHTVGRPDARGGPGHNDGSETTRAGRRQSGRGCIPAAGGASPRKASRRKECSPQSGERSWTSRTGSPPGTIVMDKPNNYLTSCSATASTSLRLWSAAEGHLGAPSASERCRDGRTGSADRKLIERQTLCHASWRVASPIRLASARYIWADAL